MLEHSHAIIQEKAELIHKLHQNIQRNSDGNLKLTEMKQIGRQEAEKEF